MVLGLPSNISNLSLCEHCKQHKSPLPKDLATHDFTLLELVHMDMCGPMPTKSRKGFSYFVIYVDYYSRFIAIYFLKHKFEVFNTFQNYMAFVENQISHKINYSDNGNEFIFNQFNKICAQNGITCQFIIPYMHEQNGVNEHKNKTLVESTRSMLHASNLLFILG
jgi:hypothetical protein